MLHFSHLPTLRASYEFTIRCNSAGRWVAEETHGSVGGSLSAARRLCASRCARRTAMPAGSISNRRRGFRSISG